MRTKIIPALCFIYFAAGAGIGSIAFETSKGRFQTMPHKHGFIWFAVISNAILLPVLGLLWRRRHLSRDIKANPEDLGFVNILVHGFPINIRIAILLFVISWILGVIVPLAFGI